jgi:hypothetical protein
VRLVRNAKLRAPPALNEGVLALVKVTSEIEILINALAVKIWLLALPS